MPKAGRVPTTSARALPACLLLKTAADADAKLIDICQRAAASFDAIPGSGATERERIEAIEAMVDAIAPILLVPDMLASTMAGIEAKALLLREWLAHGDASGSVSFPVRLAASLARDVLRRA